MKSLSGFAWLHERTRGWQTSWGPALGGHAPQHRCRCRPGRSVLGEETAALGELAEQRLRALEALPQRGGAALDVLVALGRHRACDVAPRHLAIDAQDEERVV